MEKENPMREVRIEKMTLNIGCGTRLSLDVAKGLIERITGAKSVITHSHSRSTFGVPQGKAIGIKVTIRKDIDALLKRFIEAREKRLPVSCFDKTGNVSFGIKEYIDVPGVAYDPKIGMVGFDVCLTLERPGYRIKRKRLANRIGNKHRLTAEDAKNFMINKFGIKVEEMKRGEER